METLWQDLRQGARSLGRTPGFTLLAVVTLALGIGANSAIFSLVNAVLLTPLPFHDPASLVVILERRTDAPANAADNNVSAHEYLAWSAQGSHVLEGAALYMYDEFNLTGGGDPERLIALSVTAGFFDVLGVRATTGRTFLAGEDDAGAERLAVLSDRVFKRRFGADSSVVGRSITLDDLPYRVVGVAPPSGDLDPDLWVPIDLPAEAQRVGRHSSTVFARLKPGVTAGVAQRELGVVAAGLVEQYGPGQATHGVRVVSMTAAVLGDVRRPLLVALGAVAFVLLIASANVAHLLLTRATARRQELAVRAALGAGRRRILGHVLAESVLLSLAGGALGLFVAVWLAELLPSLSAVRIPRLAEARVDFTVVTATFLVSLLTGVASGLLPAWRASRPDLRAWLSDGLRATPSLGRRIADSLVVSEIALALVLLVGAGLLLKSFARLTRVDPGFDPANVLMLTITLPERRYPGAHMQRAAFETIMERLSALPGVRHVGATTQAPLVECCDAYPITVEGRAAAPGEEIGALYRSTSPDYFRVMNIPLRSGRLFSAADARLALPLIRYWPQQPAYENFDEPQPAPVGIINETMARRYWPDQDPVGKRFRLLFSPWITVVGVVGDVRHTSLSAATRPEAFLSSQQEPRAYMTIMVKTSGDPLLLAAAVRERIRSFDADLPVGEIRTVDQAVHDSLGRPRFNATLLSALAGLALVLALVGIYGVISYSVAQRTHEIGLRTALGADAADVVRLILGRFMTLTVAGLAIGLTGALALTRLLDTLLFQVTPTDPATFALLTVLLAAVALLASYLPTRRALRVDPLEALRAQ